MGHHGTHSEEVKFEEKLSKEQFIRLLKQFTNSLECEEEVFITLEGEDCAIPCNKLDLAKLEVEYEKEEDKLELEFKVKWKHLNALDEDSESEETDEDE